MSISIADFFAEYEKHYAKRAALGIPPNPLTATQTSSLIEKLFSADASPADAQMLADRVSPGVDPAAKVKAEFLSQVAKNERQCSVLSAERAVFLLGTMRGGYNEIPLIELLETSLADAAADALSAVTLISANFAKIETLANRGNAAAKKTLKNWAKATWFTSAAALPKILRLRVYKVNGVVTTDDLSPAAQSVSRPDIPLHALAMGDKAFPDAVKFMADCRAKNERVAFVGDTVGVGSSRKSAANSLIWHIGDDIPFVPNKRRGGVVLGATIAPIFFNTLEDSGALPITADVSKFSTGQVIVIDFAAGKIFNENGDALSEFIVANANRSSAGQLIGINFAERKIFADGKMFDEAEVFAKYGDALTEFVLRPNSLPDEYRAGGRIPLLIGKQLSSRAAEAVKKNDESPFIPTHASKKNLAGFSLAQKIVGRAVGKNGVAPGETIQPRVATVGSQDTTGPMTRDELTELACLHFAAPMVLQSFCHTAAYPKPKDRETHATLPKFFTERGGFALRPGDGIIHSWLNRLLLPDQVGAGGDSHTRFPLGVSFAVGSGLAAFAAAFGSMPIDMPESVLVKISGDLKPGITLRDVINFLPLRAIELGLQSEFGKGEKNVFNGRILEIEGLTQKLSVAEAFELSCASAERSAAACAMDLSEDAVKTWLEESVAIIDSLINDGYETRATLISRRDEIKNWLKNPQLLRRDVNAEFAETLELDVSKIYEPVLALPNNPDSVGWLSGESGKIIDEVFIGSCMTSREHFRAAAKILRNKKISVKRLWITPPTRLDRDALEADGTLEILRNAGARIEIPGCSLCMGNQARVENNAVVFSTSTRNFNNRMGDGAQVYLGSAQLAALIAATGKVPTAGEYFATVQLPG